MKKLIALLLAVVMVMGLAACGSKTTTETKAPTVQAGTFKGAGLPPAPLGFSCGVPISRSQSCTRWPSRQRKRS